MTQSHRDTRSWRANLTVPNGTMNIDISEWEKMVEKKDVAEIQAVADDKTVESLKRKLREAKNEKAKTHDYMGDMITQNTGMAKKLKLGDVLVDDFSERDPWELLLDQS